MDDWLSRNWRRLVIRGARVLCPAGGIDEVRDVWVDGGVLSFLPPGGRPDLEVDGEGLVAVPGFIEIHAHLREPGFTESETVESGLSAGLAGGYTAVFAMANTKPPNDSPEVTRAMLASARASALPVRLYPVAAATRGLGGEESMDYGPQRAAGAGAVSDDGFPVRDREVMARCMAGAAAVGLPIFDHATHGPGSGTGVMHAGPASREMGLEGLPREEEDGLVARDVDLSIETGHPVHIQHLSTAGGIAAVRRGKAAGAPVTAEAAPHHLLLTDRDVAGPDHKMNPPLREEKDRRALIAALLDGTIDALATDHAPHAPHLKAMGMAKAPFGIIGMESAFPALHEGLVAAGEVPLEDLVSLLTHRPAAIGRVSGGALTAGRRAELNLLDLTDSHEFAVDSLRSRSRNCPFLSQRMRGRVVATVAGDILAIHFRERFRSRVL